RAHTRFGRNCSEQFVDARRRKGTGLHRGFGDPTKRTFQGRAGYDRPAPVVADDTSHAGHIVLARLGAPPPDVVVWLGSASSDMQGRFQRQGPRNLETTIKHR